MAWRWRWTHDDGFITFRVVDQVFAGNGPVYNAGQRVEVFTSPLHLGLLVVLRVLFGWALDQAWLSVLLTLGAAIGGLAAAAAGAATLARAGGAKGRLVPFGLLVPVALPPMWEYATAGLETGLVIGWVGLSFWMLAGVATARPGPMLPRLWPVAVVIGLGPLVRPEAAVLTIGLGAVLLTCRAVAGQSRVRLAAAALALPLAYEVFRAAYFATLVPNTALAKAAGESRWDQGWYYFVNTAGPYLLIVPVAAFGIWAGFGRRWSMRRTFGGSDGRNLAGAMVASSVVYVLYVTRVGGDYMHARMLLPPIFALCCPFAVVVVPRVAQARLVVVGAVVAVAGWAALVVVVQRAPDPEGFFGGHSIAEQRIFYRRLAGNPHPVTLDEWDHSFLYRTGDQARRAQEVGADLLVTAVGFGGVTLDSVTPLAPGSGTVLFLDGIGVSGARAGVDTPVIDLHGLADPLASRMPILRPRGLPGHEKVLPQEWALAEAASGADRPQLVGPAAGRATEALGCGDVRRLLAAIGGPATPGRLAANLVHAVGFTTLEIPRDPAATADHCG